MALELARMVMALLQHAPPSIVTSGFCLPVQAPGGRFGGWGRGGEGPGGCLRGIWGGGGGAEIPTKGRQKSQRSTDVSLVADVVLSRLHSSPTKITYMKCYSRSHVLKNTFQLQKLDLEIILQELQDTISHVSERLYLYNSRSKF